MTARLVRKIWRWRRRPGSPPAGAISAPVVHDVPQTHDDVSHYWTDQRIDAARAREQTLSLPDDD